MCGICGERNFREPVDAAVVRRMRDTLVHRGPDDEGLYVDDAIGLGFRRLAIIDLSPKGRQPMWTADRRLAMVFNGEVYNFREIRAQLEGCGYAFTGNSDSEVVLNAIHCWGLESAVSRFIGMFAFAVWDAREQALYLGRDRAGIKPLFYFYGDGVLLFASEMKALLSHPRMERRLDRLGIAQFLMAGNTLGAATAFEGTSRLLPGHYLKLAAGGQLSIHQYWSLDHIARGSFRGTFEDAADRLVELCDSAFRYRLESDVPVGLFLSGGTDSSLLAAFLAKRFGQDLLHITIGFQDARVDETAKATRVAQQLGVRHVVRRLDALDAEQALDRFVDVYDEPFTDTSGIPTSILSAVAREHVTVALSADGGDEQFCGYESYGTYARHFAMNARVPAGVRHAVAGLVRQGVPYRWLLSGVVALRGGGMHNPQLVGRFEKWLQVLAARSPSDIARITNEKAFTAGEASALMGVSVEAMLRDTVLWAPAINQSADDLVDTMMRTDYTAFLRDDVLTKVDRASMAVSLECRDPMLDHRLTEFAFSLPIEYLWDGREHKRLLKHVLRRWIADEDVSSPKQGFVVPLYEWLRGPWKSRVLDSLTPTAVRRVGVLDPRVVSREVDRFYGSRGGRAERVLALLLFQLWAEKWYLGKAV